MEYKEKYQRGGTMIISEGDICARTIETGQEHGLGRWSWIKLRGCKGLTVIIATLYRPDGALSTYQQHKTVLLNKEINEFPRLNLLTEFSKQLKTWQNEGRQILVNGDFNEDIRSRNIQNYFKQFSMNEIVMKQHGNNAPNTYLNGTAPIDGMFGTTTMVTTLGGYTSFSWGTYNDHRLLWVDLDMTQLLDSKNTPLWKPQAQRLKCENPIIVNKFNEIRLKHMLKHQFFEKQDVNDQLIINKAPTKEWERKDEELDNLRVEGIMKADKGCRKIRMGNVPWSPDLQQLMQRIDYLQRCWLKYLWKRKINSRTPTKMV
jgi:hypothetical protein